MKLFKNYNSKKEIIKENARLKTLLHQPSSFQLETRDIIKIKRCHEINQQIPIQTTKHFISQRMADLLEPHIEWDILDGERGEKVIEATLYVSVKR